MINFPVEILGILYNVKEEKYTGMNEGNLYSHISYAFFYLVS